MGSKESLPRGCVQYMSAGKGVTHSVSGAGRLRQDSGTSAVAQGDCNAGCFCKGKGKYKASEWLKLMLLTKCVCASARAACMSVHACGQQGQRHAPGDGLLEDNGCLTVRHGRSKHARDFHAGAPL